MNVLNIICSAVLVCCLANTTNAMEYDPTGGGGGDPKKVLVDFLLRCPDLSFAFDGSPESVAKGPLYHPGLKNLVDQYGTPEVREAYEAFRVERGAFALDITKGGPLDILVRFFGAHQFDTSPTNPLVEKGVLYEPYVASHLVEFGGFPEIRAFFDLKSKDIDLKSVGYIANVKLNHERFPEGYFPKHRREFDLFYDFDAILHHMFVFKRLDLIEDFIETYRGLLGDRFLSSPLVAACSNDVSEDDRDKTRQIIKLLHSKGINLRNQLEFAEEMLDREKRGERKYGKDGALENICQAILNLNTDTE